MSKEKRIYVTQPSLPPLDEFTELLRKIWASRYITNNGPFHRELEEALTGYLGVKHISLFANGTLALITALHALGIKGEVITTPFSFVATTHSLWWNGITPVFTDVNPVTGNLDPDRIEEAISPKTKAILPVHVYGTPCDTERIEAIARKHGIKVIYDAAHAFGVKVDGRSVLNCGDLSILSFHATKVYNTIEGGAIICHDTETKQHIDDLKNFGFRDEVTVIEAGINAKMNELQAAYGLLQLRYIDQMIAKRKKVAGLYRELLREVVGIRMLPDIEGISHGYAYFPVFVEPQYPISRDQLYEKLKRHGIMARRYFYPLISNLPKYRNLPSASAENLPVANRLANTVICLPIYPELEYDEINRISSILKKG